MIRQKSRAEPQRVVSPEAQRDIVDAVESHVRGPLREEDLELAART